MPSLPPGVLPTTNMTIPLARQQGMLARWQWRRSGLQGPLHQLGHRVGHGHHLSFIEHIKSRDRHVSCMHGSRDADVHAEFIAPCPLLRARSASSAGPGCMHECGARFLLHACTIRPQRVPLLLLRIPPPPPGTVPPSIWHHHCRGGWRRRLHE